MSLIVEALKKSEAQRRLGQSPNLATPTLWDGASARKNQIPNHWWRIGIVLTLLLLALAMYWLRSSEAKNGSAVNPKPVPASTKEAENLRNGVNASDPQPASHSLGNNANDALRDFQNGKRFSEPSVRETTESAIDRAENENQNKIESSGAENVNIDDNAQDLLRKLETMEPRPHNGMQTDARSNSSSASAPINAVTSSEHPLRDAEVAPLAEPEQARAQTSETDLPYDFELPSEVKAKLPSLKISMHVYSATPSKRFVIINGARRSEGDSIATGLLLKEVREQGVVLQFEGRSFLLSNPKP